MPRVSIVLTSYNCAPYLPQAIESILGQTFGDLELLISDDCSLDGSAEIARSFAGKDERVRLFQQDRNLGLVGNYNFLFQKARGDLVGIQDADDWSDPTRLERQVAVLSDERIAVCGTGALFVYPDGRERQLGVGPSHPIEGGFGEFPSHPASALFSRNELDRLGGWPSYFEGGTSMDRYFLMELLDGRRGWHIGEPLYFARVRASSSHRTWTPRKMATHHLFLALQEQRKRTGTDDLKKRRFEEMDRSQEALVRRRDLMTESLRESAVIQIDCGNLRNGASLLGRAFANGPLSSMNWRTLAYLVRAVLKAPFRR